jgi:4-aminobutyrate aminotransferase
LTDFNTRFEEVLAPVAAYDTDVQIVASDGVWVTDSEGNKFLDFACGISVTNVGHQHPGVKAAVLAQVDQLWHAGGSFKYESKVRAAEALRRVTPDGIDQFLFMNSGAEAVEASVKLARKTTGRQGVIVFRGGFHGRTMGSVSYTTSKAKYRQGYHPILPSVFVTPFPHPFRWGMTQEDADRMALDELKRLFEHEIEPSEVAAFLVEPVQGEGGYYPASPEFLGALREMADRYGILLILDEVQTGFGRTGTWFASDQLGVKPDVLVMGKAIANGLPLSAVGASTERFSLWKPGSHGTTFGGNPIACAAAAATITALQDVIPAVGPLADHATARFRDIAGRRSTIGDVRGLGLMIGIELSREDGTPDAEAMTHVKKQSQEEGMFILSCGPNGNVIRFIPPLVVTREELDQGIDIVDRALASYEA